MWPWWETLAPLVYTVPLSQGWSRQLPGLVGGVVGGVVGGSVGGVAPAKRTVNLVKSQSFCATLEQEPDSPGSTGPGHCRSRLTDQ